MMADSNNLVGKASAEFKKRIYGLENGPALYKNHPYRGNTRDNIWSNPNVAGDPTLMNSDSCSAVSSNSDKLSKGESDGGSSDDYNNLKGFSSCSDDSSDTKKKASKTSSKAKKHKKKSRRSDSKG